MKRFFSIFSHFLAVSAALIVIFIIGALGVRSLPIASAQVASGTAPAASSSTLEAEIVVNDQQIAALNQQIATYQQEIQQTGANKATLQAAINSLDLQKSKIQAQVSITQTQINNTQLQIQQLGGEITNAQQSIQNDEDALGAYFRILQKADDQSLLMQILSSNDLSDAWSDVNATLQIQDATQNEMKTLQSEENDLASSRTQSQQQQASLTTQQAALTTQQQSLAQTVQSKSQLLAETSAQESTYEKLLAAAESQLQSFSTFAQNAGGSKLLGNETLCDSWGCYYSQRDTAWGSDALDGTKYTLAADGCLVTALAMVLTHYGYKNVTPVTINSNPANFAAYYPAYLLTTINVDGATVARKTTTIDATLATGNPVIVGLDAFGGTHYVVLVSGSKGNYIMKDPYITNGDDASFSANYSLKSIFGISKVVISS